MALIVNRTWHTYTEYRGVRNHFVTHEGWFLFGFILLYVKER